MSTTHDTSALEDRLVAALAARAELVQPEDLAPLATVATLRPRWQSPWVLLATAAAVLLVLGVVLQGVGGRQRSDDVAPRPDDPKIELELPADVGRDWKASPESTPARVDLDGDGAKEKVEFLGEETKDFDGRIRLQTTLSSTGEEAYGVADVASTVGAGAEGVVDADGDGDQELVVFDPDLDTSGGAPLVFDLREGLLVQVVPEDPSLLQRGDVQVPGSQTGLYDRVRVLQYWIEDGRLFSGRSEDSFARTGMTTAQLPGIVLETWEWRLGDDGVLRREAAGCKELVFDVQECDADSGAQVPDLTPATETVGVGESADITTGFPFSIRVEAGDPPVLVGEGQDGVTLRHELDGADPRVATVQPESIFSDGESLVVTSASDPTLVQLLVQRGERIVALDPVGEVPLENTDDNRTWLTEGGSVVSVTAVDDGSWQLWSWQMTSGDRVFALPGVTVCFDDVDDPTTARRC
ncbi:hypothetical protein ASG76_05970 [Nocardioides sp. Soil774]|uniref:hypothetical protein n=1 Tax=Nocardioides sp. Soil774 TaxID=1736408 RepID=UPI0006FB0FCD|nr:hypothetical protein [Nocardioides sp. Soil774]KRE95216.1 hypothetical protein ASG76_05970 [Nocardioides sp. Soil774]